MKTIKVAPDNNKGFTLIELLLTIAILFIIAGSSTAFYSRFLTQNSVINLQDQLINQLRKAQIYAMMGKQNTSWGLNIASGVITLFSGSAYSSRNVNFDEKITYQSAISITPMEIVFAKTMGTPNNSGSLTITASSGTKIVTINSQGMITR